MDIQDIAQLLDLSHEIHAKLDLLRNHIEALEYEINHLDTHSLGFADVILLQERFDQIAEGHRKLSPLLEHSLTLAWNTERADLIEALSLSKEHCLKSLLMIGKHDPKSVDDHLEFTGLYAMLNDRLFSVYGRFNEPDALVDNDPALEGLAKIGLWYLHDCFALGLIPSISNAEQLELSPENYSEQECIQHRRRLFQEVRQELAKHGLVTVKDLKRAGIFSISSLEDFLLGTSRIMGAKPRALK